MADINQWRRKIYPGSKTPTAEQEERAMATTPRTRPRLTHFLSHGGRDQATSSTEYWLPDQWTMDNPPRRDYDPDIDRMAAGIISAILTDPHAGLTPNFNSPVMHIIEAYGKLFKEKQALADAKRAGEERLAELEARLAEYELAGTRRESPPRTPSRPIEQETDEVAIQTPLKQRGSHRPRARTMSSVGGERTQTMLEFLKGAQTDSPKSRTRESIELASIDTTLAQSMTTDRPTVHAQSTAFSEPGYEELPTGAENPSAATETSNTQEAITAQAELSSHDHSSWSSDGDAVPHHINATQDWYALRKLAKRMAAQRGIPVEQALSRLADVFYNRHAIDWSNLDGTQRADEVESYGGFVTGSPAFPRSRALREQVVGESRSDVEQSQHMTSSRTGQTQHMHGRQFSFSRGDDSSITVDESNLAYSTRPQTTPNVHPPSFNSSTETRPSDAKGKGKGPLQAQETTSAQPPPQTVRKTSRDMAVGPASNPPPSRLTHHGRSHQMRESSSSSIVTVVDRSSENPDETSSGHALPGMKRRSSGQPTMAGSQAHRRLPSEAGSTGMRRPSARRESMEAVGESTGGRRLSEIAAVAATRAAEERGKRLSG